MPRSLRHTSTPLYADAPEGGSASRIPFSSARGCGEAPPDPRFPDDEEQDGPASGVSTMSGPALRPGIGCEGPRISCRFWPPEFGTRSS
jgi:hypothetical protein